MCDEPEIISLENKLSSSNGWVDAMRRRETIPMNNHTIAIGVLTITISLFKIQGMHDGLRILALMTECGTNTERTKPGYNPGMPNPFPPEIAVMFATISDPGTKTASKSGAEAAEPGTNKTRLDAGTNQVPMMSDGEQIIHGLPSWI